MDEQQGGEFAPAVPTTGEGYAAIQTHAKFAEIRRRPCLDLQPVQFGTQSLLQIQLQAEPGRRSQRMARSLRELRDSHPVLVETGSNSSDSTSLNTVQTQDSMSKGKKRGDL